MHASRYAAAAAITAGIVYSVVALALMYAREASLGFLAHVHYMDSLAPFAQNIHINAYVFASGLIQVMLYSFLIVWIFLMLACRLHCHGGSCDSQGKGGCCK